MTRTARRTLATLAAALAFMPAAQAASVDVSASDQAGASLTLAAGDYLVNLVGTAGGGAYDGWNAWNGQVSGCGTAVGSCTLGWLDGFTLSVPGQSDAYYVIEQARYATAAEALQAAQARFNPIVLHLESTTTLNFWINDIGYYDDNVGGVSLAVTAVPEPAALALLLCGLLVVAARRNYRSGWTFFKPR